MQPSAVTGRCCDFPSLSSHTTLASPSSLLLRLYDILRDSEEQALDKWHAACLDSAEVAGLHRILRKNPWHVPTLLSLAEVHFFSRANDETGQDLVRFPSEITT